jgi:cbb3-type cytochrome oxidase subunit 3
VEEVSAATSARRSQRDRSALESLLSIALLLESVMLFFVTLTLFGLKVLPPGLAFGAGLAMIVLLTIDGRLVRYPWGRWLGWALQGVIIAAGFLLPMMFFIGAVFLGIWIYCFVTGRRLDAAKARYLAEHPADPLVDEDPLAPNPAETHPTERNPIDPKETA